MLTTFMLTCLAVAAWAWWRLECGRDSAALADDAAARRELILEIDTLEDALARIVDEPDPVKAKEIACEALGMPQGLATYQHRNRKPDGSPHVYH